MIGLHVHGEHSFLDGLSTTDQIAQRAKELGQSAVALTDHGECSGHVSFEKSCKAQGVKPIFGMEGYLSHNIAKQRAEKDRTNSHIVLLAENQKGLSNLWAISSLAYREENFYYKPLADWDMLKEHSEGLIATSACMLSFMARAIVADDYDLCRLLVSKYQQTLGEDNFFLELHTWQIMEPQSDKHRQLNADMSKINQGLVQLSKELSVPTVVVNDAHYSWPEQAENHSLVWQMSTNADQTENKAAAAHIMGHDEIVYWMSQHGISRSDTESAIANTDWIGERCNAEIERRQRMPRLTTSEDEDLALFKKTVEEGYQRKVVRIGLDEAVYRPRLDEEMSQIIDKRFYGYLNVVADYCLYAKRRTADKEAWLVGPSRGSAGGSLVCYVMSITEVDPVKYNLIFARFISPDRKGFPDIDLDFPQSKRELLKQYFAEKYGGDHVCGIGTLARMHPKSATRDLGRAMAISYPDVNAICKVIDKVKTGDAVQPSWDDILEVVGSELQPWIDKYPYLFAKVRELAGLVRNSGTHAAGLIISGESLIGQLPTRRKGGNTVTQFEYPECEELGFIKFDILGVRHLDTLTEAWKLANSGQSFDPEYFYGFTEEMYADEKSAGRISTGDTLGIFQIETALGSSTAKELKPRNERDMNALISVVRPGVIRAGLLDEYLKRRSGKKAVSYSHPLVETILAETFGIVIYQEQVMEIAVACGGYTLAESDRFRKMMGKKLWDDMKAEKPQFIERCSKHLPFVSQTPAAVDPKAVAEELWNSIEASGAYAFNKAHGQGYGLVCCWGSYGIANTFPQYLTALLRTDPEQTQSYIKALRKDGHAILPPDINESGEHFTLTDAGIRFGLSNIKHVGKAAISSIMEHRPFSSFEDFLERTEKRACNARIVECLIKIGAFETLGPRETHLKKFYERIGKDEPVPNFESELVVQQIEKELVGLFISSDPMERFGETIRSVCVESQAALADLPVKQSANIGGQITLVKEHDAKNGRMAWIDVVFDEETYTITIFADRWKSAKVYVEMDAPVVCKVIKLARGYMLADIVRLDYVEGL